VRTLAVIWRSEGRLMAIASQLILEVLPPVSSRPALGAPGWVRGLFPYRGTLIPLVDAATLLGTGRAPDRMSNRVVVVRSGVDGASTGSLVGLWVESVLDVDYIDFDAAGGHPGFATDAGRFLGPVTQTRWGQVQQILPQAMFTAEQALVLRDPAAGVTP
jgi:chemotaxis-related protein WspB